MTYDAWKTTEPDIDGPCCAICRKIGVPLERVYLTEWWCEACVEQEEEYQHDEEYSR
jgi:hypothetical protein